VKEEGWGVGGGREGTAKRVKEGEDKVGDVGVEGVRGEVEEGRGEGGARGDEEGGGGKGERIE